MKNRIRRIVAVLAALTLLLAMMPFGALAVEDVEILSMKADAPNAHLDVTLRVGSDFYRSDFEETAVFHVDGTEVKMVPGSFVSDEPIGYILVIDRSGYYTAHLKYDYVKQTAVQLIRSLPEQDRVAVVFVDSNTDSNGQYMLKSAAETLVNGSTCASTGENPKPSTAMLYQGLQTALQLAAMEGDKIPQRKAIVILSDFGADDDAAVRTNVLQKLDGSIPLITIPFFCEGYSTNEDIRKAAMAAVESGRPELLGRTMINVEIVRPANQPFDPSQISSVTNTIMEKMNFASFKLDITPLYQAGVNTKSMRLQIQDGGSTVSGHVSINVSALPTPVPTEVPVTPTPDPNPVVLRFGDENATVLKLQQILTDLYYYEGELNRKFDTNVQIALMNLCNDNNLEFTDELRQDVWEKLQTGKFNARETEAPVVATPEPTRDPNMILLKGDTDSKVYVLQQKLVALGYLDSDDISLVYDDKTQVAMYGFCENNDIELEDGVTIAMWNLLSSGNAVAKETETPAPEVTITPAPTRDPNQKFASGDKTGEVRSLQNYLINNYYMLGEHRSGVFDENTQWAVDDFCRINQLDTIDDGMSLAAWELLSSGSAMPYPTDTPEPVAPAPTRDPSMKFIQGDMTGDVVSLQRRLEKYLYLDEEEVSGVFDQPTYIAVVSFCEAHGLPVVEGMSYDAWNLLLSDEVRLNPDVTPTPVIVTPEPVVTFTPAPEYLEIKPGDSNEYVRRYQQKLLEMGYLTEEFVAGTFDEATQKAQDVMCEYNKLAQQTGANVEIQRFAFSSTLKDMSAMGFGEKLKVELSRNLEIGTLKVPVWVLASVAVVLILVVIIVLVRIPAKKTHRGGNANSAGASASSLSQGSQANSNLQLSADEPPTGDIDTNTDVPTSENVNEWPVVLTIQYMGGAPTDFHYMLSDDIPIKIGRRSGSDVLLNANDTLASRDHGQLVYRGSQLYYCDASKKGSVVDGTPVHMAEKVVSNGSVIEISRHTIRIGL